MSFGRSLIGLIVVLIGCCFDQNIAQINRFVLVGHCFMGMFFWFIFVLIDFKHSKNMYVLEWLYVWSGV